MLAIEHKKVGIFYCFTLYLVTSDPIFKWDKTASSPFEEKEIWFSAGRGAGVGFFVAGNSGKIKDLFSGILNISYIHEHSSLCVVKHNLFYLFWLINSNWMISFNFTPIFSNFNNILCYFEPPPISPCQNIAEKMVLQ